MKRRLLLQGAATMLLTQAAAQPGPRVIPLLARRYRYEPAEIALKVGEPVVVEIRSLDFVHGMNIPDLGRRLDLLPGLVARLELQPKEPGVIEFLCDNFCGEGHEEMQGRFIVQA